MYIDRVLINPKKLIAFYIKCFLVPIKYLQLNFEQISTGQYFKSTGK